MSTIGEQITASQNEFLSGPLRGSLIKTLEAFKDRPLTPADFDLIKKYIDATVEAASEKLLVDFQVSATDFSAQRPKDRRIRQNMLYMSAQRTANDLLSPVSNWIEFSSEQGYALSKPIPVIIPSRHVEFRHVQRTAHVLRYTSGDVIFAVLFSMPLNKVLDRHVTKDNPLEPFAIPHSNGLFLGEAFREEEVPRYVVRARRGKKVEPMKGPQLDLPLTLRINTFVSFREMQGASRWDQREVHKLLNDFRENAVSVDALFAGLDMFSRGAAYRGRVSLNRIKAWEDLSVHVERVTQTRAWQSHRADSLEQFRRRENLRNTGTHRPDFPEPNG